MKDIVLFESNNPNLFNYTSILGNKVVEIKNNEDILKNKRKKILFYNPSYKWNNKIIKNIKSGAILINLGHLIYSTSFKRASYISQIQNVINMCLKQSIDFTFASFAKEESHIRDTFEKTLIAMLFLNNLDSAKKFVSLLSEFL